MHKPRQRPIRPRRSHGPARWFAPSAAHLPCALLIACGLAITASTAQAQGAPTVDTATLLAELPEVSMIEARLMADVDGDRIADVVFVGGTAEARKLVLLRGYRSEVDFGYEPALAAALEPYPLGAPTLLLRKGVLVVADLTGGTTALQATYRYRADPGTRRMRLIGLDAERYSRSGAHPPLKVSWNLVTGAQEVRRARAAPAASDAAWEFLPPARTVRRSPPLDLAATPSAEDLVDAALGPAGAAAR